MNRNSDIELTPAEVRSATGLTPARLRFWSDGRVLDLSPSIPSKGQGSANLFSLKDYQMLSIAQWAALGKVATFSAIGLAVDKISAHPDWPRWEQNRGNVFAKITSDNRVLLEYSPRVIEKDGHKRTWDRTGELEYETLMNVAKQYQRNAPSVHLQAVAANFLNNNPDYPNTDQAAEALIPRVNEVLANMAPAEQAESRAEISPVCMILSFDLRAILDAADLSLEKVLSRSRA